MKIGGKWVALEFILKMESAALGDRFDVWFEKQKGIKDYSQVLWLNVMEKVGRSQLGKLLVWIRWCFE